MTDQVVTFKEYTELNNKLTKLEIYLINIDQKLDKLLNVTDKVDVVVHEINKSTSDIYKSTSNMDNHITFVETVYDTLSTPMYYIMNKFSKNKLIEMPSKNAHLIGYDEIQVHSIENNTI